MPETDRAIRAVTDAFVRRAENGLLLPRIVAIGDAGEAPGVALDGIESDVSAAVDPLTRRIILARLVQQERALAGQRGLDWRDQVNFGLDYAETLLAWRVNFDRAVEEGRLPAGFDACFIRLWRFYLIYCEAGFRGGGIDVVKVTLVKC